MAAALAALLPTAAGASEIKVLASNAVGEPYRELIPLFEKASGHTVIVDWGGTLNIIKRLEGGEVADFVIIGSEHIDRFVKAGLLVRRVDLVRSGVGAAVRAGAPHPDISSPAALKQTLLAAKSIVLSSGPSGMYLPSLFERMGIADALKPKITQLASGLPVGEAIARGEGEIGFTQTSEFLSIKGIDYLGPLPGDTQLITVFAAGLHAKAGAPDAARALIQFLKAPEAAPALRHHGMEPG
ncbi:MAG: substrate-binding domain-containing protein [Alphaproteobacteria bacterium]|nr:substrate-binding domain-containing protein [Alphaproteobacteria bacterium]